MSIALKWAQGIFLLLGLLLRNTFSPGSDRPADAMVGLGKHVIGGKFESILQDPANSLKGLLSILVIFFASLSMLRRANMRLAFALPYMSSALLLYFYPPDMMGPSFGIALLMVTGIGLPLSVIACGWRLSLMPQETHSTTTCANCGYPTTGLNSKSPCPECGVCPQVSAR